MRLCVHTLFQLETERHPEPVHMHALPIRLLWPQPAGTNPVHPSDPAYHVPREDWDAADWDLVLHASRWDRRQVCVELPIGVGDTFAPDLALALSPLVGFATDHVAYVSITPRGNALAEYLCGVATERVAMGSLMRLGSRRRAVTQAWVTVYRRKAWEIPTRPGLEPVRRMPELENSAAATECKNDDAVPS